MIVHLKGMAPLLQVYDMGASIRFYRDILGFRLVQSSGEGDDADWVLLQLDEIELMLNTAYEKEDRPTAADASRVAAHSDTTLYFGCPDIDVVYTFLHEKGVRLNKPEVTGYGWSALTFPDPDGYQICFHCPVKKNGNS